MKVSDAVQHMTKTYLHRIIDSFTKDLPKVAEEKSRDIILRNVAELTDTARIATVLKFEGPYSSRIVREFILEALINRPRHAASEADLIEEVTHLEQIVIDAAANPEALKYESQASLDTFAAVLSVAIEDDILSHQELHLIERLRQKLGIRENSKRLLMARLNHFPRAGNRIHTPSEFNNVFIDLQRRGVLFYCNRLDGGLFVIPDEIVAGVQRALGLELNQNAWSALLDKLDKNHLSHILESKGLPKSGTKGALKDRLLVAGISPSQALDTLPNSVLYKILASLPGAKVSGSKQARLDRIIQYFSDLVTRSVPREAEPAERYYRYLVELAQRDRRSLLANKVIRRDLEIDRAFEAGTRYLFEYKLGLQLMTMPGSDHADGGFAIGKRGHVLLWDNKSKETVYRFPQSHLKQFKRYIRDCQHSVSCFLVIVPAIADGADYTAAKLKVQSGSDTDVALITAEDLLWLTEEWLRRESNRPFDPEVFNITGILDRQTLEMRMSLFH